MSCVTNLICVCCGRSVTAWSTFTCPDCGPSDGILDVQFDLSAARRTLTRESLAHRPKSHWRYRELIPLDDAFIPVSTSDTFATVGWTPIIDAPRLAHAIGVRRLRLKDDGRNPSGSFKDRPSSVGVQHALQRGYREVACASTGNAASSLAQSAAAAGLACNIFVAKYIPDGKLAQLLAYGARVFKVDGTYAHAYDLCTQACARFGWYNRNAAINPYLVEGKKTGGCEVAEQCADDPPEWVAASVGDGCSIAGVHKGMAQMRGVGVIDWSAKMLGVQAAGCAPLVHAFQNRPAADAGAYDTYADSINCPVPRNPRKALTAVRESGGTFVGATDAEIMEAVRLTGRLTGVFAEPAAAAAVAGVMVARREGVLSDRSDVLAMITGNGLKDVGGAVKAVGNPHEIPPQFDAVLRVVAP